MVGRFLGSLPVRPRTAIAIALLLVVALVVLVGKLIGGQAPTLLPNGQSQLSTVDPSEGDDGVVELNPSPSVAQPASGPAALSVATTFAQNWIDNDRSASSWRSSLAALSTPALTSELAQADPVSVPAERLTGAGVTQIHAETSVDIIFPTDAGTLRLRLVLVGDSDGRWLVDGIDWERA